MVPESAVSEVLTFEPQAKPCDPFASFLNGTWGPTWQNNICSGYQEAFQGQVTAPYWASQITSSWLSGLQELRIVWAHEIESLAQASCKLSGLMVIAVVITFELKRFKI